MTPAAGEPVDIREATSSDRPAMLDLGVGAWTAVRPAIDFGARRTWLDQHLDALAVAQAHIFVAVVADARLAGFGTLDPASGRLDQLVTAVWAQGRGVGRALLRHAKRLSPGGIVLSVNHFNTAALRVYAGAGFSKVGEGINPLSGLPVWHMRWDQGERAGNATDAQHRS